MFQAVTSRMAEQDIIIKAAAVADYTPATVADNKIKKTDGEAAIALTRTKDILGFIWENIAQRNRSYADFLWKQRICWKIPVKNW